MSQHTVLYQIVRERDCWWFVERNAQLVAMRRDLFDAVDMATSLAEREAARGHASVKVVWRGHGAC
nr:hypothetical protein [Dyella sp. ASV24]